VRPRAWRAAAIAAIAAGPIVLAATPAMEQLAERPLIGAVNHPAITYHTRPTRDRVAALNQRLESGEAHLAFEPGSGYLRSVLDALKVPVESQMLVMSKTGIQGLHTGPTNPRAILFNDAVTVGYIRGAPLLELTVVDPEQGIVFYVLAQQAQARPQFDRRSGCLTCHNGYSTLHVPGLLARSVAVAADGLPLGQYGTYDADDRTPFRNRWGGWYVTGTHGAMRHMGNGIVAPGETRDSSISERTLNRVSLDGLFDPATYPSRHSDIAALMVFQHQVRATNLIIRIGWEARIAAYAAPIDWTSKPFDAGIRELVDDLLFVDEEPLTAPIKGTSGFAEMFSAGGPADAAHRSLRQLDLERRLLRYPCSFMIDSEVFAALPAPLRAAVYARMFEVLSGQDADPKYARLADADRRAIIEILRATRTDLPDRFK
jgi:hypothetical protein